MVLTNGCFDLLHLGHVDYLFKASTLGESLVVAVNSDVSVRMQEKGKDRPIFPLLYRMRMLASLSCVDYVLSFEDKTPLNLICKIRPEVLVKGGDWPISSMVGSQEVQAYGGRVLSIPFHLKLSTTEILGMIRRKHDV